MSRFINAFVNGKVHIVVLPRMRAALVIPVNLGVLKEGSSGHVWVSGKLQEKCRCSHDQAFLAANPLQLAAHNLQLAADLLPLDFR
ncbi:hypothetical protein [Pseudomonas sp. S32]|uniref:hypothetical protein n=1 Tax=Pseudomonas sp. S32 TaxID=2767448 RepID=UPI002E2C7F0E|nr:hypothetical protein [Pseudomonas sp. S32]